MADKPIRKSPSQSASLYKIGTKKKGNDGNMWIIQENKRGIKRWVLFKKVQVKKYTSGSKSISVRKSPSNPASSFKIGAKKKGNDGNTWIVKENKNGIKRWALFKKVQVKHTFL